MPKAPENLRSTQALVEIVSHLRGPEGCAWDKEQTHESLTPYAIEEVHELVEAVEQKNDQKTKEELGDVLFQVILHSQLASERNAFNYDDVVETLNKKMVHRHPHVFGDEKTTDTDEIIKNWEILKKAEKKNNPDKSENILNVPTGLPALQRAAKIGFRTHKLKFDWSTPEEVWQKVEEELRELEEAIDNGNTDEISHEIGDVFFSLAQYCRHLDMDPENILRSANRRFESRFTEMMKISETKKLDWDKLTLNEKESLWQEAKRNLKK